MNLKTKLFLFLMLLTIIACQEPTQTIKNPPKNAISDSLEAIHKRALFLDSVVLAHVNENSYLIQDLFMSPSSSLKYISKKKNDIKYILFGESRKPTHIKCFNSKLIPLRSYNGASHPSRLVIIEDLSNGKYYVLPGFAIWPKQVDLSKPLNFAFYNQFFTKFFEDFLNNNLKIKKDQKLYLNTLDTLFFMYLNAFEEELDFNRNEPSIVRIKTQNQLDSTIINYKEKRKIYNENIKSQENIIAFIQAIYNKNNSFVYSDNWHFYAFTISPFIESDEEFKRCLENTAFPNNLFDVQFYSL